MAGAGPVASSPGPWRSVSALFYGAAPACRSVASVNRFAESSRSQEAGVGAPLADQLSVGPVGVLRNQPFPTPEKLVAQLEQSYAPDCPHSWARRSPAAPEEYRRAARDISDYVQRVRKFWRQRFRACKSLLVNIRPNHCYFEGARNSHPAAEEVFRATTAIVWVRVDDREIFLQEAKNAFCFRGK